MNLFSTIKNSNMENFFPKGWDLDRLDQCCSHDPDEIFDSQKHWHKDFTPVACDDNTVFSVMMGHEIALTIKKTRDMGKKLAVIWPVGPMGMYRWLVYFLKEWTVSHIAVYDKIFAAYLNKQRKIVSNTKIPSHAGVAIT